MRDNPNQLGNTTLDTLRVLLEGGPSELAGLLGKLPGSTREAIRKSLQRLKERGLVELLKGKWTITSTGIAQLSEAARASTGSLLEHSGWPQLIAALPIPEHRAVFRLGVAITLAKTAAGQHLGLVPWVGIAGRPGTGKSHIGRLLLAVLGGLEVSAATAPAGEVLGRRISGAGGITFEPSPLLAGPVALIDELDKAPSGAIGAYFQLLEGRPAIKAEGQEFPHQAAIIATWNPSRGDLSGLPEGVARRSIILDTSRFTNRLRREFQVNDKATAAWSVLKSFPGPWVSLEDLKGKEVQGFTPKELDTARSLLFELATPQGQEASDTGILHTLAVGYTLMGHTPSVAIAEAVSDLCMVRATRPDLIQPQWPQEVARLRATASPVVSLELEVSSQPDPNTEALAQANSYAESIQFETARSAKIGEVDYLREHLGRAPAKQTREERIRREGFLGALRHARGMLEKAQVPADLQAMANAVEGALVQVRCWLEEEDSRKQAETRQLEHERRTAEVWKQQAKQRAESIRQLRAFAKSLHQAGKDASAKPDSPAFKRHQAMIQSLTQKGWIKKVPLDPVKVFNIQLWQNWRTLDMTVQPPAQIHHLPIWMEKKARELEAKATQLQQQGSQSLVAGFQFQPGQSR